MIFTVVGITDMAMPDSVCTTKCWNCDHEVFVRKNKGGFAYYRCEACGVGVQHHIHRNSESFIRGCGVLMPDAGKIPEITAPKPLAAQPGIAQGKPAKRSLLSEFMDGGGA